MYANEGLGINTQMENVVEEEEDEEEDAIVVGEFQGQHQIGDDGHLGRDELMAGAQIENVHHHHHPGEMYAPQGVEFSCGGGSGRPPNQLTLSFQGGVFVFDAVVPEKVQAVLLLLGGYEVPSRGNMGPIPQDQRAVDDNHDMYGRPIPPQRAAALSRFREKKKDRCFDKKIRYTVRKEVAHRMQRRKGQFVSAKVSSEDMGSASSDGNGSSGAVKDEQETSCKNCGTSSKKTPMMR